MDESNIYFLLCYKRYKYCVYIGKASSQEGAFHHIITLERSWSFLVSIKLSRGDRIMITFDDAEKQKLSPEDLKKLKQHNDINEWPCPLTDDMKKQMHDSFKVVPKKK